MKVNLILNDNNIITDIITYPIVDNMIVAEIENISTIHVGFDKYIDGNIVIDDSSYEAARKIDLAYFDIQKYKKLLAESDYKLAKFLEGELTEDEYAPIKAQRKEWRAEINRLEGELK